MEGQVIKRFGYSLVSIVLILGILLSGCAAPKPAAPAQAPAQTPSAQTPSSPAIQPSREQVLLEAAKKEGEVMMWTYSYDRPNDFEALWKEKYPSIKLTVWDASRATDGINRQVEEAKAGRHTVDLVIWPAVDMGLAVQAGVLQEYEWPNTKNWTDQPQSKLTRNITVGGRAPVYNTELVAPADVPKSWDDINNVKWRGKAMISTSAREIPMGMAYVFGGGKLDWDKSFTFWREVLDKTRPVQVTGFTGPMERIAAGELPIFLVAALEGSVFKYLAKGAPLAIAPVNASGALNSIAVTKNAPHPNAAKLLADFLSSTEGLLSYTSAIPGCTVLDPVANPKTRAYQYFQKAGMKITVLPSDLMTTENNAKSSQFWVQDLYKR